MSSISTISIRRPVLAMVMSIVIVIFGLLSWRNLGVREYPVVEPPVITVSTSYSGANAEIIEREITEPLEAQINAVSGIRTLSSISEEGRSEIRVEFNLNIDLETAVNDVRDRVGRAAESLPEDANPPSVRKEDPDASPIVFININSPVRDLLELTQIARDIFRERIRTIDGVSIARVMGQQRYTIRLWMDPQRLAAYNLTPLDVRSALAAESVELPSGTIEGDQIEFTLRTMGRLSQVEEFENLIIREYNGQTIRFRDIGTAEMGTRDDRSILKRNGIPMVGVAVIPVPGTNQIETAQEVHRRVDQIKSELPPDIEVSLGFDVTEHIQKSISDVQNTILFAFFLVIGIIFVFLRDYRTTFIPIIVVPISLIGSFFIMYMAGFTINILTLLALILSVGLVVDDAIIVLENIYTKMESGMPAQEAGIEGTREIFFAVIATTLVLISVFTPILFLDGTTGRLFREFGIVIAGVVVISSFVGLTLVPMMSVKLLKPKAKINDKPFFRKSEQVFDSMHQWYRQKLDWFFEQKNIIYKIFAGALALILFLFLLIPEELAPLEDRSSLNIRATAPEGATFQYMDQVMDQIIEITQQHVPEVKVLNTVTASSGSNTGQGFVTLSKPGQRRRSQDEIAGILAKELSKIPEAQIYISQPPTLSDASAGLPIQYVIQTGDASKLREVLPQLLQKVRNHPDFSYAETNLKFDRPVLNIEIDRDRARNLGVSVRDIAQTLQSAYSGQRYGYFEKDGRQYWVQGQMLDQYREKPEDLYQLNVRNNRGQLVRMDNLVNVTVSSSPPQLYRFNRIPSATISAALADGRTIEQGIRTIRQIGNELLDESFTTELSGPSRDFEESAASLNFTFLLAIVFIFLVLSAQFESFKDPLIILLTVPLALLGALFLLWFFDHTLNIFSKIGIIMLIGLITKNGILIVEFANQNRAKGLPLAEAVKRAALSRFRPILMTTMSTLLGILPIALALGSGGESRVGMGVAVIGGLLSGTFLTLFVIPVVYVKFKTVQQKKQ